MRLNLSKINPIQSLLFIIIGSFFCINHTVYAATSEIIDLNYTPTGQEKNYPKLQLQDGSLYNFQKIIISPKAINFSGSIPLIIYLHGNNLCNTKFCNTIKDPKLPSYAQGGSAPPVTNFSNILNGSSALWGSDVPDIPPVIIAVPASTGASATLFPGMQLGELVNAVQNDLKNNPSTKNISINSVSIVGHSGIGCNNPVWGEQVSSFNPWAIVYADTCFSKYDQNHNPTALVAIIGSMVSQDYPSFITSKEIIKAPKAEIRKKYRNSYQWGAQNATKDYYFFYQGDGNHGTPITFGMMFLIENLLKDAVSTIPKGAEQSTMELIECGDTDLVVPDLIVPIPGLKFITNSSITDCGDGKCLDIPLLAQYISTFFKYTLGVALIASAIIIIYGGMLYLLGSTGVQVQDAKQKIVDALVGFSIFIGAYVILSNVNPNLIAPATLRVPCIKGDPFVLNDEVPVQLQGTPIPTPANYTPVKNPTRLCSSAPECKQYCSGGGKTPPQETEGMAKPADMKVIPDTPGVKGNKQLLRPDAIEALRVAGLQAQSMQGGPYTLVVTSAYRPLSGQLAIACAALDKGQDNKLGGNIAFPGGSLHGTGVAVDLILQKDGANLTQCCTVSTQTQVNKQENVELLQKIMSSVGWVRYCHEIWHFEWGVAESPTRSKNCTWPPT